MHNFIQPCFVTYIFSLNKYIYTNMYLSITLLSVLNKKLFTSLTKIKFKNQNIMKIRKVSYNYFCPETYTNYTSPLLNGSFLMFCSELE